MRSKAITSARRGGAVDPPRGPGECRSVLPEADRDRLADAVRFALDAHADQKRKGTGIPYASHLLQVAGLVFEAGGDVEQVMAALLHDSIEDCEDVDAARIHARFGEGVASIVVVCTDVSGDTSRDESEWGVRKTRHLESLASAPTRARVVAACDKLHNLRSLVGDLRAEGVATLERFTPAPARTRWYYESAHRVLRDALPGALALEFDALIDALREFVPHAEAP